MSKAANTGNGYPSGMKNRIINGGMDISQRGTSFLNVNSYTLDRWYAGNATDAKLTVTQSSDVPPNNEFNRSLRLTVTTADNSLGAVQRAQVYQHIEGYNVRDLIGRTFTLSFWVRSTKTGTHCVFFRSGGSDRSYVAEYTVIASNTWEYKTVTVSGGLITAGTWDWTNGIGLGVFWTLCSGADTIGTAGSWLTGNYHATSNQVNCLDTIGNIFAITGVQLELGPVATPFEHRLYGTEFALCQRYCRTAGTGFYGVCNGTGMIEATESFPAMRAYPAASIIVGKVARFRTPNTDNVASSPGLQNPSSTTTSIFNQTTGFTGLTTGTIAFSRSTSTDSDFMLLSAEL